MATPIEPSKSDNVYFSDTESGAEMARLIDQDHLINQGMGGLLSERSNDFSGIRRILDIGCGPGGWALEVAFAHPEIEVIGFDISQAMIDYARTRARVQGLHNASFQVKDMMQPLDFPDNSFDLVNGRFTLFIPTTTVPKYLQECMRITRPGGTIRLTESEWTAPSTSLAMEQLLGLIGRALKRAGQSFSPSGNLVGITPVLRSLLREAGCINIGHKAHVIDYSSGEPVHDAFCKDFTTVYQLMQPFIIGTGVATQEEADRLRQQMQVEMLQDDFRAIMFILTAWGEKPQ